MADLAIISNRRPSPLGGFARWFRSDLRGALSLSFLVVLVAVSVTAPWVAPHSPRRTSTP
jgi:peptide/nickel transport system permease protein